MKDSRLVKILKTLSTREKTKFKEYIFSPIINKNLKIRRLAEYILSFAPHFESNTFSRKNAFKVSFQEEGFRELSFNNVCSDLLQLLYDFLAFKEYQELKTWQKELQMRALRKRELYDQAGRVDKRFAQIQKQSIFKSYEFYLTEYQRFDQLDQLSMTKGKRGYDENLQLKNNHLDLFYFTNKLRIACDMYSRNTVVNAMYECYFLDDIEREISFFDQTPAIQIYFKVLQMLRAKTDQGHYKELIILLENNLQIFPSNELRTIYNYALNYCVKQINFGNSDYYQEILALYKVLLQEKIIFKNGYLTQWTYINIIAAGIRLKNYDWTETFIHNYKEFLQPENRDNVYGYNLAVLYFEQKKYDQALSQLMDITFTDPFFHLSAKLIQLKCYYMLHETEALFSLAEASRQYISRNKQLSDYHKKSYNHFFKMATKIHQLSLNAGIITENKLEKNRHKLQSQLQSLEPLANKGWLKDILMQV